MLKNKPLLIGVVAVAAVAVIWYFVAGRETATVFDVDTTIEGDYVIAEDEAVRFEGGATLTVNGNLDVSGVVEGDEDGIAIVVKGGVAFADSARVSSEGSIQVAESAEQLATTQEKLDELFESVVSGECEGVCVGPLLPEEGDASGNALPARTFSDSGTEALPTAESSLRTFGIPAAQASSHTIGATGDTARVSGTWDVQKPKQPRRSLILFWFPNTPNLVLENLTMTVPPGDPGTDDIGGCDAKGGAGHKAGRLLFWAQRNVRVNNVTLTLGEGGVGGSAETDVDCYPKGRAEGGPGGESGNLRILAGGSIAVEGVFRLNPGNGGAGGDATAYAGDGPGPGEPGGDAEAVGGAGAKNVKELKAIGAVSGVGNVEIGSVIGGAGGSATALPGDGGDGVGCGSDGGRGGDGTAVGGKGGDAKVTLGGAGSTADAADVGGRGGDASAVGGEGGEGGDCDSTGPGGRGGDGGDAEATPGAGGASDNNGEDGEILDKPGGDGGNGGDGCPEGAGGEGGSGDPDGENGERGKNLCVDVSDKPAGVVDQSTSSTPSTSVQPPATTTPPATQKIRVIQYGGKYLPVSQLIVESEGDCGDHYHAASGVVTATDGTYVPDPGPPCGYGAVASTPVIEV